MSKHPLDAVEPGYPTPFDDPRPKSIMQYAAAWFFTSAGVFSAGLGFGAGSVPNVIIGLFLIALWGPDVGFKWYRSKIEIRSRDGADLYLTRYFLFGHSFSRYALMVHHMHQPDDDACHHDHPWWFLTCVLKGGYVEEVSRGEAEYFGSIGETILTEKTVGYTTNDPDHNYVEVVRNPPGVVRYRPATHTHRIAELPTGSCWTLVLRGRKSRSWGFHTDTGWVWWREFIETRGAVAWCADRAMRGYRWITESK